MGNTLKKKKKAENITARHHTHIQLSGLINRAFSNFNDNIYTNNFKVPNGRTST